MAPASRSVEPPCVAPGQDAADLSGLPLAVVQTITQARAPSTRQTYALKWSLIANWCSSRREDPRRCTIGVVLSFLEESLEHGRSPPTLKVYVYIVKSSQVTFIYIALLTIQIVTKHCTILKLENCVNNVK